MATTNFPSSSVHAVKLWSDRLYYDVISDETMLGQMISDGTLVKKEDTQRGAGDQVKYSFLNRLTDKGLIGMQSATGNEVAQVYYQDTMNIDQLRLVVANPAAGTIDAQRVVFDLEEDAYENLRNWMLDHMHVGIMNQLAGNTATSITYDGATYTGNERLSITGMNAAVAPSGTGRIIRPNGLTTDQAVNADSTATMKLSLIDEAEKAAQNNRPYIRTLSEDNGIKYKCYVHIDNFYQLIQDDSGPVQYRDIFYNQIAAGKSSLIGRSFDYSQTRIIATDKVPYGVHSGTSAAQTNVRRAVFVGREAGCVAFGQGYSDGTNTTPGFAFKQDMWDVENIMRIAAVSVFGISKSQFNSTDHGSIVISAYAP